MKVRANLTFIAFRRVITRHSHQLLIESHQLGWTKRAISHFTSFQTLIALLSIGPVAGYAILLMHAEPII